MRSTIHSSIAPGVVEAESTEEQAGQVFDRAFSEAGATRACVLVAFESVLQGLPRSGDREEKLSEVAKAAALSTARSHGNIIETGRTLLAYVDELASGLEMDVRRCKDQVMLGLAEGACQVGPIVYGRFLDIASEYRDNADDWIAKNRRRTATFDPGSLPVIVPFEAELTLQTQPFREPAKASPAPREGPSTAAPTPGVEPSSSQPACTATMEAAAAAELASAVKESTEPEASDRTSEPLTWSRPKGKGFFRRLSDVMGSFFGRG